MSLEQKTRRALFAEIVDNMECLQRDVEGCVSWVARDVNTKHNLQWLDKNYSYLRVHFPIARIKRKPRKLASQLLHLFAKKCDFECERRTRCYMLPPPEGSKKRIKSTSAFVCVKID